MSSVFDSASSAWMRRILDRLKLKGADLAAHLKVTQVQVSRMRHGHSGWKIGHVSSVCRRYREQLGRFDVQAALYLSSARSAPPAFHPLLRKTFTGYAVEQDRSQMAVIAERIAREHGWSCIEMVAPGTLLMPAYEHQQPSALRRILREGRDELEAVLDENEEAQIITDHRTYGMPADPPTNDATHPEWAGERTVEPATHADLVAAKEATKQVLGGVFTPPPGLFD